MEYRSLFLYLLNLGNKTSRCSKVKSKFFYLPAVVCLFTSIGLGQLRDSVYKPNIATARLYNVGDQLSMPIISLNSSERVELHFDDLDADVKNYYYTYQLCDYDWNPVAQGPMDYIRGFTQIRLNTYRFSAIAYTRYTHYQAVLPGKEGAPSRSGNYILKVYTDGDPNNIAFTKRFLVVDNKAVIGAQVSQPFAPEYFKTHQKVQFKADVKGLNDFNAAQNLKVVILQNYRWDNAQKNLKPAFVRGAVAEYNSESYGIFEGGKEWRWLDLRDFKLQSDRVASADYGSASTDIFLKTDVSWLNEPYVFYNDLNGKYLSEAIRGINPFWEADYATVHFSFMPKDNRAFSGKDLYVFGALTGYDFTPHNKMTFNTGKGRYETTLFLKQGYYDYTYILADNDNAAIHSQIDGNYYETENAYTILVYYKSFTSRNDELIGAVTIKSKLGIR